MNNNNSFGFWGTLALILLILGSCSRKDPIPPFTISELTKDQRELLGKRLEIAILTQPENYPIRSRAESNNEIIYNYLQAYYNQATYFYRLDRDAPITDRWNINKLWRVHILESLEPQSFTLPGGDFYISTGMLSALKNEAELFALMSFEATLMQERILIKELSEKYAADIFIDLLELGESEGGLNSEDLLINFLGLNFEEVYLINIDRICQTHICNASAFDKNSLQWQLESVEKGGADQWLEQKSYAGRDLFLEQLSATASCGSRVTNGSYSSEVLDLL